MKYAWAVPGAKVMCVDGSPHKDGHPPKFGRPVKGVEYTISWVGEDLFGRGFVMLRLSELPNPWIINAEVDGGWSIDRFRPLRTVEDDVALFAHHLTPAPTDLTVV